MNPIYINEKFQKLLDSSKNGIIEIDSGIKGPNIGISAITHGNEISGIIVIDDLVNNFLMKNKLKKGKITLILANYKAFQKQCDVYMYGKRFIDEDMNRIWHREENNSSMEELRKNEIKPYINKFDVLFDIHSTSSDSTSMLIPSSNNKKTKELLSIMEAENEIYNIMDKLNGKAMVQYHSELNENNISIAFEAGQHTNVESIKIALDNSKRIMSFFGMIDLNIKINNNNKKIYSVYDVYKSETKNIEFHYSKNPKSFDEIEPGVLILKDGDKPFYSKENKVIIMPTKNIEYVGEEVFYKAKKIT